ncbi:hypothetical protein AAH446_00405 [Erwinia sp. P6884]|uniref:hypothetical protein n=1 Tax=Erwinia sp. P6884 TaxID=3141450 RepID=UPI00319B6E18
MKIIKLSICSLALLLSGGAFAAQICPPQAELINNSNGIVLLGGTAKGPVKQVVLGEFGRDVNQQRRILGQFDECGALLRADIHFEKNENNVLLKMEQSVAQAKDGWQADYAISVFVLKQGQAVEVNHKKGTINYLVGKQGTITSATESFLLKGEKGFTETVYSFDRRNRLIKSVARSSDNQANGETRYRWNGKNQLVASDSAEGKMSWTYDKMDREQSLSTQVHNEFSEKTTLDECQLWDKRGNCTLSYLHETEIYPKGEVRRNISAAYRYEYWEK